MSKFIVVPVEYIQLTLKFEYVRLSVGAYCIPYVVEIPRAKFEEFAKEIVGGTRIGTGTLIQKYILPLFHVIPGAITFMAQEFVELYDDNTNGYSGTTATPPDKGGVRRGWRSSPFRVGHP